jgi:hypothetical protein
VVQRRRFDFSPQSPRRAGIYSCMSTATPRFPILLIAVPALVATLTAGCSPQRDETEPLGTDRPAETEPRDTTTTGTAQDLYSQIRNRTGRIEVAIVNRSSPEVAELAADLRRLFKAIGSRDQGLDVDQQARLRGVAASLDSSAARIEAAAGELHHDAAQAEFARLQGLVDELGRIPFPKTGPGS